MAEINTEEENIVEEVETEEPVVEPVSVPEPLSIASEENIETVVELPGNTVTEYPGMYDEFDTVGVTHVVHRTPGMYDDNLDKELMLPYDAPIDVTLYDNIVKYLGTIGPGWQVLNKDGSYIIRADDINVALESIQATIKDKYGVTISIAVG